MDITIIGLGNMGCAIGTRAAAGGHSVTFVGRTLESAQEAADEVRAAAQDGARYLPQRPTKLNLVMWLCWHCGTERILKSQNSLAKS